jgi:hypothetical protein
MDERYQIGENKCVEKVLDAAFKDWSDTDNKLKDQLMTLLTHTVKVAFADGYDIGYCNGMDDSKSAE